MSKGMLIVLSGPSGVGKGTVRQELTRRNKGQFIYSVSMTTRQMRPGEENGVDYFFSSEDDFKQAIKDDQMLEYNQYVGNYYGTPRKYVEQTLNRGQDVFLEIDVGGAMQVKEKMPDGVFIFLTPPDLQSLRGRITGRGTDSPATIDRRMDRAVNEINLMKEYDYAVVNDVVSLAADRIEAIIESEHLKVERVIQDYLKVLGVKNDYKTNY
ncbi:guanylate kinase [Xylocopilactobacillus apicola]|uniref:Guanylate kinase n=1 Tax=Xylocopilactobacillus apicola TaxID=2932184 RepID=A0AAU9D3X4_9LACO|nr:guanylate kinase [Xylocopilactobacillus apicola]BDR58153.1 guanylate kinase [Xylocopilactobacillus apicola]